MNKLFTSLAFGLCFTASQFAVAADGGFYGVAAVGQMVGKTLPTSVLEQSLIQYDGGVRNSKDTSLATNLSFGYALNRNTAVEGGYMTSTSRSSTTGFQNSSWGVEMAHIKVPFSVNQEQKFTAVHASVVGTYALNDFVGLYGRVGVMRSETTLESRTMWVWPNSDGTYQGRFVSEKATRAILGVGATMKMTNRIDLRVGLERMGTAIPTVSLIVRM